MKNFESLCCQLYDSILEKRIWYFGQILSKYQYTIYESIWMRESIHKTGLAISESNCYIFRKTSPKAEKIQDYKEFCKDFVKFEAKNHSFINN